MFSSLFENCSAVQYTIAINAGVKKYLCGVIPKKYLWRGDTFENVIKEK